MGSKNQRKKAPRRKKIAGFELVTTTDARRKIGIAFFLTSLIPILILVYVVFFHANVVSKDQVQVNLKVLIALSLAASLIGYWITRKIAASLAHVAESAKEIVEGGRFDRRIESTDECEEMVRLVQMFNQMTEDLQQKVRKLEHSKTLIQGLLKKIGSAVTSTPKTSDLLELIVVSLVDAVDSESGVLILCDEGEKNWKLEVAYGKQREVLIRSAEKGEEAFRWLIGEGERVEQKGQSHSPGRVSSEAFSCHSLAVRPLRFKGRLLGYLAVINKNGADRFSNDDDLALENVASQMAVAVDNRRLDRNAERAYVETIAALAMAVEAKDHYTRGHVQRVSDLSEQIARAIGMSEKDIQNIRDAAVLHDVGKIAIEDRILLKEGKLSDEEMAVMRTHAEVGEKIIAPLHAFEDLRKIVRQHQERYDGSGYPDGLKGEEILLGARILAVADVYDSMATDRPYRQAFTHEETIRQIIEGSGKEFDPEVVKVFLKVVESREFKHGSGG